MFGYVMANRPELKIREYDRYRAYYCGLCRALKKEYGLLGRLTLNYDMTFLVMLSLRAAAYAGDALRTLYQSMRKLRVKYRNMRLILI